MFKNSFKFLLFIFFINFTSILFAIFPINFDRRLDINFKTYQQNDECYLVDIFFEKAFNFKARNTCDDKKNILQLWSDDIDSLTMIRGFKSDTKIGQLASSLNLANDDGVRGHIIPRANLDGAEFALYSKFFLPYNLSASIYIPFYEMELKNLNFEDKTRDNSFLDDLVKKNLTTNFRKIVEDLGGLKLTKWRRSGIGDIVAMLDWDGIFPQEKPVLKKVHLNVRAGFNIPTGKKANIDEIFSIPFGFGNWGIFFGAGIDLNWWSCLQGGIDAEFLQVFSKTQDVRIKTDPNQTDLIYLAKTRAIVDPGFLAKYNIYLEAHKFAYDFSFRVAYQYLRRGEESLWLLNNDFSNEIANTAESLQHWTIHQFWFILNYNNPCKDLMPNFSLFYKLPFNGVRSLESQMIGFNFSISF